MPDEATLTIRFDEAGDGGGGAEAPARPGGAGKVNPQTAARQKAEADAGGIAGMITGNKAKKGAGIFGEAAARIPGAGKLSGIASKVAGLFGGGGAAAGTAAGGTAAATGGAAASGGSLAAIGGAIAATGPAAPIAAAVAVTAGAVLMAVKKGLAVAEAKTQQLAAAGVSPEIAAQQARAEAATIKSQQKQAEIIGDELARIGEAKTNVSLDFQEIKSVLMEPLFDLLADLLEIIESITEPLAEFMVDNKEEIKAVIKFLIRIISPMTNVIEWWASIAGAGDDREVEDPLLEFIAMARGMPVERPQNVMDDAPRGAGDGGNPLLGAGQGIVAAANIGLGGAPGALAAITGVR